MDGSQLPVFTHEYLGTQNLVKTRNVDKAEFGSNVPFICKKHLRSKVMISIMKSSSKVNEIQEEGRNGEANELLPMLQEKRKKRRDLNLGYPHLAFPPESDSEDHRTIPQR